jgi:cell division septal protein FtsQ
METRIRQRKNQIPSRRIKRVVVLGVASTILVVALLQMPRVPMPGWSARISGRISQMMKLDQVVWEEVGSTNLSGRITKPLLWDMSGLKVGDEMLGINLDDLERKLTSVPWIESLQIQKKLPSTLIVKYTAYHARALGLRKNKIWTISTSGKYIAQVSSTDPTLDLPLLANEANTEIEMQWLDTLEKEMYPYLVQVQEINVLAGKTDKTTVLFDLKYPSQIAKISLTSLSKPQPQTISRLKRVVQYLIKNNILVSNIDLRPGKKVVVNVGKRP